MRLTVVGCSPAWPNPGSAHAGYLLEGSGSLLVDCGPGVLARLRERDGWPDVDAIVITHFHLDHWGDLVPWCWGAFYYDRRGTGPARPQLWVPPGGRDQLAQFGTLLGFDEMFERAFELDEYQPGPEFEVAGYTVSAWPVPHYLLHSHALRISHGGRTLAYSGDCGPTELLGELARDADLFLCEATLASGAHDGDPRGHLSLEEARAAFAASGARRLLVTHRPAELPLPDGVELARDGMSLDL